MKTIATFAFFFYLLWGPIFTIGVIVYCLRKLGARTSSIPWYVLAIAVMSLIAGPVYVDGALPGFMPWWAFGLIAHGESVQNYVLYYILVAAAIFAVRFFVGARTSKQVDE